MPLALYPDTPPYRTHAVNVCGGHVLHVEESGRADGTPAVVLHGGPGSGCSPLLRRFFDPTHYHVICIDQRGSGLSTPRSELVHNTTQHLLDDLRTVREFLGLARWLVVGGSWGATLAIAHACREPRVVSGLLLRSVFLARREDVLWFFQGARSELRDEWACFAGAAPADCAGDLLSYFAEQLAQGSTERSTALALAWWRWEQALAGGPQVDEPQLSPQALCAMVHRYRVQSHFLLHQCWLSDPGVLTLCEQLPAVPTLLLHGEADRICLPSAAQAAHQRIASSQLRLLPGAGHALVHPAMVDAMVDALDSFALTAKFDGRSARWLP